MTDAERFDRLARAAGELHWMARRYADGRSSTAPGTFNDVTRELIALRVPLASAKFDGTLWAKDGMGRAFDGLTEQHFEPGHPLAAGDAVVPRGVSLAESLAAVIGTNDLAEALRRVTEWKAAAAEGKP